MISKKKLGYRLFGLMFTLFRLCPLDKNKVFLVATHDDSPEGNIALAAKAIKEHRERTRFVYLTDKGEGLNNPFSFFFVKAFHMATASVILLDDTFLPMAYTPISKKARVIQLWHGTGTIKRFGPEVETGELQKLAIRGNRRITTLTVNGERTKKQYASAFCINPKRTRITGLPRTDLLLDKQAMAEKKEEFFAWCKKGCPVYGAGGEWSRQRTVDAGQKASEGSGTGRESADAGRQRTGGDVWWKHPEKYRYVLYAPTFRDNEVDHPRIMMDTERVLSELPEDVVLLLRLHPHVAKALRQQGLQGADMLGASEEREKTETDNSPERHGESRMSRCTGRVIDVSGYKGVTTLLSAADVLITDYSSIIFEYAVLEKPMIFYAYDLDDFRENGRDFYEPYEDFVPGPVVRDESTLVEHLKSVLLLNEDRGIASPDSHDMAASDTTTASRENMHYVGATQAFLKENFRYLDGHAADRVTAIALGARVIQR